MFNFLRNIAPLCFFPHISHDPVFSGCLVYINVNKCLYVFLAILSLYLQDIFVYIFVHGLFKLVGHIGGLDASIVEGHNDYREMFYCGCSCSGCE